MEAPDRASSSESIRCSCSGTRWPVERVPTPPLRAVPSIFLPADDPQAAAITHLWVRPVVHNALEQSSRVRADGFGPAHHPRRRPLQVRAMTLRSMLLIRDGLAASAAAQVRSDARAFVQDFDRGRSGTNLHQLMH